MTTRGVVVYLPNNRGLYKAKYFKYKGDIYHKHFNKEEAPEATEIAVDGSPVDRSKGEEVKTFDSKECQPMEAFVCTTTLEIGLTAYPPGFVGDKVKITADNRAEYINKGYMIIMGGLRSHDPFRPEGMEIEGNIFEVRDSYNKPVPGIDAHYKDTNKFAGVVKSSAGSNVEVKSKFGAKTISMDKLNFSKRKYIFKTLRPTNK